MSIEAMKQWLETLEYTAKIRDCQRPNNYPLSDADKKIQEATTSLHQTIAEAEAEKQEPVAYRYWNEHNKCFFFCDSPEPVDGSVYEPLYNHPQPCKPLTDEQIEKMRHLIDWTAHWSYGKFARAIEAAHGIKE